MFGVVLSDLIPQKAFLLLIPSLERRDLIFSLSSVRENILVTCSIWSFSVSVTSFSLSVTVYAWAWEAGDCLCSLPLPQLPPPPRYLCPLVFSALSRCQTRPFPRPLMVWLSLHSPFSFCLRVVGKFASIFSTHPAYLFTYFISCNGPCAPE